MNENVAKNKMMIKSIVSPVPRVLLYTLANKFKLKNKKITNEEE